ncbi:MAG: hypothetical protein GTO60_04655, partial [Gammaproteobacteria bacterium]|nr:hypothetical protein [Gammaproteobacteria bacterium]NIO61947.1 hypothetical protein [Gammaproteobacteria bacterium]
TRDDLVECSALLDAVRHDELDELRVPVGHLDVLSQQLVAEVTNREWHEDELYKQFKSSYPYRDITKENFSDVIRMLSEGYSTRRGRRSRYIHYDSVNRLLRPARGAKITAVTNGGAIPDHFDYDV